MVRLADDLEVALELADVADAITRERFGASDLVVDTKPDLTPVTEADTAAERAMREHLATVRPGDVVVGEEFGSGAEASGARRWIIDPIDGTKNYVRGLPVWATLIALEQGGELTVGVVSAPALARRWWAARGEGAYALDVLSGVRRRLQVSAIADLADAQLSLPGLEHWLKSQDRHAAVVELVRRAWRTRGFGDFWGYMLLAEGGVDVTLDAPGVCLWDLAAPQVIVEEAGGRFSDLAGARTAASGDALATNGLLHEAVLAIAGR